jgi:hypothetical protein
MIFYAFILLLYNRGGNKRLLLDLAKMGNSSSQRSSGIAQNRNLLILVAEELHEVYAPTQARDIALRYHLRLLLLVVSRVVSRVSHSPLTRLSLPLTHTHRNTGNTSSMPISELGPPDARTCARVMSCVSLNARCTATHRSVGTMMYASSFSASMAGS